MPTVSLSKLYDSYILASSVGCSSAAGTVHVYLSVILDTVLITNPEITPSPGGIVVRPFAEGK